MKQTVWNHVQIYSEKPLPEDELVLKGSPYEKTEEGKHIREKLKELGVLFFRDFDHSKGVVLTDKVEGIDGYYSQFALKRKTGEVPEKGKVSFNRKVWINWITEDAVNRNFR